jgi:hypothetical protein
MIVRRGWKTPMEAAMGALFCRAVLALAVAGIPLPLEAQTREFLDAPLVKSQIRVQWDATAKKMTYAVDDDRLFRELPAGKLFLTKTSVFVTYPSINPLRIHATASASAADDPARATIAKLLEAIMTVATTVQPAPAAADREVLAGILGPAAAAPTPRCPARCPAAGEAQEGITALNLALFGDATKPATIKRNIDVWIAAIDSAYLVSTTSKGPAAVNAGITSMATLLTSFDTAINEASVHLAAVDAGARKKPNATDLCEVAVNTVYQLAELANPRARLDQLTALRSAVLKLKDALFTEYVANGSKWVSGHNYKISPELAPTPDKMQNVLVRTVNVIFKVDPASSALSIAEEDAGAATLTIRRYSPLAPEVGVGAVFGFLKQPQYGTSKNAAGETIVSRIADEGVSIAPSILVNFVCRCATGPLVAPMLQIGASTSKEAPAILVGGGLRLFSAGAGDVAVGGGWLFGWVKDLQALREGDVVSGTKEIEADKGYTARPQTSGYFVIQYKF